MNENDISAFLSLVQAHAWVPLASLVIGVLVRLVKADVIGPTVPPRWRPYLALGLGVISGVLDAVIAGQPWLTAILGGLASAAAAILGHDFIIAGLRNGKEIPVPAVMRPQPKDGAS
jgi:hypothetical protein